jgi:hypothetical protein
MVNFYLKYCVDNASRLISTGVSDATSIQWQRLNEASCPPVGSDDCANEQNQLYLESQ